MYLKVGDPFFKDTKRNKGKQKDTTHLEGLQNTQVEVESHDQVTSVGLWKRGMEAQDGWVVLNIAKLSDELSG